MNDRIGQHYLADIVRQLECLCIVTASTLGVIPIGGVLLGS